MGKYKKDFHYQCLYFTKFNVPKERLEEILEDISKTLRTFNGKSGLICGDFNSKAVEWGHPFIDQRGVLVNEWMAMENLYLINDGRVPTFVRGPQESYIDLSIGTEGMVSTINNWRVAEEIETLSDHQYILFNIGWDHRRSIDGEEEVKKRWDIKKLDREVLLGALQNLRREGVSRVERPEQLINLVTEVCDRVIPKPHKGKRRPEVSWWSVELTERRRECISARRRYSRSKRYGRDSVPCVQA